MGSSKNIDGVDVIRRAAADAASTVANAAVAAVNTVANATAEAISAGKAATALANADIAYIKADIAEIKQKLDSKYVTNETFSPVKTVMVDYENRIRKLETWGSMAIGALALAQIALKFYVPN